MNNNDYYYYSTGLTKVRGQLAIITQNVSRFSFWTKKEKIKKLVNVHIFMTRVSMRFFRFGSERKKMLNRMDTNPKH